MNVRKELTLAVALIFIAITLYFVIDFLRSSSEKTNVEEFIIEDLKTKHPNAEIFEIISMEIKFNDEEEQYYFVKARVTEGISTPCPIRIHYYYNYPEQNFVTQPPEYITTSECKVCKVLPCTLVFEEEAIIASHTADGTEEIHEFISENKNVYPVVIEEYKSWRVFWYDSKGLDGYEVLLSVHGEVEEINKISK